MYRFDKTWTSNPTVWKCLYDCFFNIFADFISLLRRDQIIRRKKPGKQNQWTVPENKKWNCSKELHGISRGNKIIFFCFQFNYKYTPVSSFFFEPIEWHQKYKKIIKFWKLTFWQNFFARRKKQISQSMVSL